MSFSVSLDVPVPMRDGTRLATSIWRPDSDAPVPVLLVRNPYGSSLTAFLLPNALEFLRHGYAVAIQDCRGTFGSQGTFAPHAADADDGEDTVTWLSGRDWCDGNVGSWGGSYLGFTQWAAAATGVPSLKAIAPSVSSADLYRAPWYSPGGALSLSIFLNWSAMMSMNRAQRALAEGAGDPGDLASIGAAMIDPGALSKVTPVSGHAFIKKYLPWMIEGVLGHPERDASWRKLSVIDAAASVIAPALHIGGWYDLFCGETLRAYTEMRARAGTADARDGQRLIVGPWTHTGQLGYFRERNFGPAASMAAVMAADPYVPFFDRWVKGDEHALDGQAPVRIFVMGIDRWRDEQDWPLPDTTYTPYYLGGNGPANTAAGDGALSPDEPAADVTDTYLYDPRRPVPTVGGVIVALDGHEGPEDQSPLHTRDDVLCFATGALDGPVEVTGPVKAALFVSSSAVDTDFTAKLVDVHPGGKAIILCEGIARMRYRDSLAEPRLMTPGEVYEVTIDLGGTANVFLPGHRILLEVSSSNFPRYDRNSNTGGVICDEDESDMVVAVNRVLRGPGHPSRLILPVIDRA